MPRYFFNVHDGRSVRDTEGTVLRDIDAARREAVKTAAAMLSDDAERFWTGEDWSMDVVDVEGVTLFTLTFSASRRPAGGR
jgi:hypothetical protein